MPMPTGVLAGRVIRYVTLPASLPLLAIPGASSTWPGKLLHSVVAPTRLAPNSVISVGFPGARPAGVTWVTLGAVGGAWAAAMPAVTSQQTAQMAVAATS